MLNTNRGLVGAVRRYLKSRTKPQRAGLILLAIALAPLTVPALILVALAAGIKPRPKPFVPRGAWPPVPEVDEKTEAEIREMPDTFVVFRILGNDLPPRHKGGQTLENLTYVLENESDFKNCKKVWIVNRIVDPEVLARITQLLDEKGQEYKVLPFDYEEYGTLPLDFARLPEAQFIHTETFLKMSDALKDRVLTYVQGHKNRYVMNVNQARNVGLDWMASRAKWVIPLDGNCFVADADWARITGDIKAAPDKRYFWVPMHRLETNDNPSKPVEPSEAEDEPHLIFRFDANERFDEAHLYGRRSKVELLARLGVKGAWDKFYLDAWDLPAGKVVADAYRVGTAGLVRRLASGRRDLESADMTALMGRGFARNEAIRAMFRQLDAQVLARRGFDPAEPVYFKPEAISAHVGTALGASVIGSADEALTRGPFSVMDKSQTPPSGNKHDYYHPAPYWWPNPKTADGLPFVRRDGEREPRTILYSTESEAYDRTRLQLMMDDTISCALAYKLTDKEAYRDHALRLLRVWFLEPSTQMSPHLRFAQVRPTAEAKEGAATGLIEFRNIAYLLDALRLLGDAVTIDGMQDWLREYLDWAQSSPQGLKESHAFNNHGLFYDVQIAAITAFLGDTDALLDTYVASVARLDGHFEADGRQPHELTRTTTKHYCAFNLTGWASLYVFYGRCGFALDHQQEWRNILTGANWFLEHKGRDWPYPQISEFDEDRFVPLEMFRAGLVGERTAEARDAPLAHKPLFHPDTGVAPYWQIIFQN